MNYRKFAKRTEGETLEDIVHKVREKAQELLEDQGIAAVAFYTSPRGLVFFVALRENKRGIELILGPQ